MLDILSNPPVTTHPAYPDKIAQVPNEIVLSPEAQTLLIVVQGTCIGIPAPKEAYRAGAYPTPAETTFPKITSSTWLGSKLMEDKAPFIAVDPSSVALIFDNFPKNVAIGVLFPATI